MEPKAKASKISAFSVGDIVEGSASEKLGKVVMVDGSQAVVRTSTGDLEVMAFGNLSPYLGDEFAAFRGHVRDLMSKGNPNYVARALWREGYRNADQVAEEIRNQVVVKIGEELSTEVIEKMIQSTSQEAATPASQPDLLNGEMLAWRTVKVCERLADMVKTPVPKSPTKNVADQAGAWLNGTLEQRTVWVNACSFMATALNRDITQAIGMFIEEENEDPI